MQVDELLPGAWVFTPERHDDDRGFFVEWFRGDVLREATGRTFDLAQANHSRSRRGVVRGIHFAAVPPGQAKYVYCPEGEILDVVVDIRVGSPTFGRWESVVLDPDHRRAVFVAEGIGHGFVVLSEWASLCYVVNAPYTPAREFTVSPVDAHLAIDWQVPRDELVLSPRDVAAPSLLDAKRSGLLPTWPACQAWYDSAR
ncbi:MAG TPA: dTDP-4-dehydrorhamnose 3,5-epimerase [Acidimicrobiales bacterium]